jgi:hypothetical protein
MYGRSRNDPWLWICHIQAYEVHSQAVFIWRARRFVWITFQNRLWTPRLPETADHYSAAQYFFESNANNTLDVGVETDIRAGAATLEHVKVLADPRRGVYATCHREVHSGRSDSVVIRRLECDSSSQETPPAKYKELAAAAAFNEK